MTEHLERETRLAGTPSADSAAGGTASVPASELPPHMQNVTGELADVYDDSGEFSPEVAALVKRCLDGTEPMEGKRTWDHDKFNARHVNMVLLRLAGFKVGEIAEVMGCGIANVSNTLHHPYGKKILNAMMLARGTRVLDIRTRLDLYAGEILDQMVELTSKSNDLEVVTKVGFGLLDRAGYNATQKVAVAHAPQGLASDHTLSRLANALEQSTMVDAQVMPAYVPKGPPENQGQSEVGTLGAGGRDETVARSPVDPAFSGIRLAKVSNE